MMTSVTPGGGSRYAFEACASARFWARGIGKLGHKVRLIPPACVKPFLKRQNEAGKKTIQ